MSRTGPINRIQIVAYQVPTHTLRAVATLAAPHALRPPSSAFPAHSGRVGIAGMASVLFRGQGLQRCTCSGGRAARSGSGGGAPWRPAARTAPTAARRCAARRARVPMAVLAEAPQVRAAPRRGAHRRTGPTAPLQSVVCRPHACSAVQPPRAPRHRGASSRAAASRRARGVALPSPRRAPCAAGSPGPRAMRLRASPAGARPSRPPSPRPRPAPPLRAPRPAAS
jgi:hypothetical protein